MTNLDDLFTKILPKVDRERFLDIFMYDGLPPHMRLPLVRNT